MPEEVPRNDAIESIIEGKKMEAYAEHRTKEMHACTLCGAVGYKKRPMRPVGQKWICIDCLRVLKETLDGLDQWEAEIGFSFGRAGSVTSGVALSQGDATFVLKHFELTAV